MGLYDDIIGAYDIIGARGDFSGYPQLAFGAEGGDCGCQPGCPPGYGGGMMVPLGQGAPPADPAAVAALVASKQALGLASTYPRKARVELLGFPPTNVPNGATLTITTQPQVLCKIFRIVIPSDIAFQFMVHEFKVGKWNLFANGEPVPAAMLDELASDIGELNPDTAQVNAQISITVENISNAPTIFRAGCFVKAIE